jgi:hypothetical protein
MIFEPINERERSIERKGEMKKWKNWKRGKRQEK